MATYKLKVYRHDEAKTRARAPLDLLHESSFEGPDEHDAARLAARKAATTLTGGGRVMSSSTLALPRGKALAPGARAPGFTVTVDVKG